MEDISNCEKTMLRCSMCLSLEVLNYKLALWSAKEKKFNSQSRDEWTSQNVI